MSVGKGTVNKKIVEASHDFQKKVKSWKAAIEKKTKVNLITFFLCKFHLIYLLYSPLLLLVWQIKIK